MRVALGAAVMAGILALAICVPATLADGSASNEALEPEPYIVWLGVDCSAGAPAFAVSLPDNVLIGECEVAAGRLELPDVTTDEGAGQ